MQREGRSVIAPLRRASSAVAIGLRELAAWGAALSATHSRGPRAIDFPVTVIC
jgi:hypothetical protein